ncbi:MAG: DUF4159 domain-containing protein [Candidatus Latescibacterota bacterium]|nr:DUF4159 domain-containing protein [Candidatus Latescibacterota bacterium]
MSPSTRFASPSQELDLDALLRGLRRTFWLAFGFGIVVHLGFVGINPFDEVAEKAPRPLMTKFIKREPRMTKPLELRKIPKPKRQLMRRQVRFAAARMDQVQATSTFNTGSVISSIGSPGVNLSRSVDFGSIDLEPTLASDAITTTRQADDRVDMALEMLDVNSMDTGRYRAMLVQDPMDKQSIKGFINFAQVVSGTALARGSVGHGAFGGAARSIDILVDALNEFTGIKASFIGQITYDDSRLMEIPFLIPQGSPNESEMENLARYLQAGGFVYGGVWTEALVKYGGMVQGQDFWSERLPEDHPVFTSFFDLRGGVPAGYSPSMGSGKSGVVSWNYVTGHFVKGRLSGISFPTGGTGLLNHDRGGDATRQIQMAINVIIYALTQEGSMTQRLMQMVQ